MGVKAQEPVTVRDLLEQQDQVEVEVRCQRCGQPLMPVVFWEDGSPQTPGLNVAETGKHGRVFRARMHAFRADDSGVVVEDAQAQSSFRGPRTGSGIWMEYWSPDGDDSSRRGYARKVCKCGDNRNWTQAKLAIQPVRMEPKGPTVYL